MYRGQQDAQTSGGNELCAFAVTIALNDVAVSADLEHRGLHDENGCAQAKHQGTNSESLRVT